MAIEISTEMMKIGDMDFEVDVCGDQSSEKLALFLHGFPETSYAWRYQMPLFAALGYKCWALNQRGYGKTSSPQEVASYNMEYLIDDVAKIIDASKCKSVTLIAHDFGAVVAWRFALTQKRPLERLIIMNVPHPKIFANEIKNWRQLKKSWYVFVFQLPIFPEYYLTNNHADRICRLFYKAFVDRSKVSKEAIKIYRQNALRPGGMTAMLNWYRSALRMPYNKGINNIIDVPTLMIWGEKDIALGIHTTIGTEKLVKDFTIRYLPDTGHFVQEEAPEKTNEIITAWLQGKPVPGSNIFPGEL